MDWSGTAVHEPLEPLDLHAENTSANMVLVVVGHECTDHLDTILLGLINEAVDAPRGVHHKCFAGGSAAYQVHEVRHVTHGNLTKVEIRLIAH